jgi:RimJ/RimL family protein N-acetyltransferase
MNATIRPLGESDWAIFRAIRLEALRTEPHVYTSRYDVEVLYTDDEWRSLVCGDERRRLFGLFDGDGLIGITGVFASRDDPSGKTAVLAMSYIVPAYRGKGLSRLLYQARLDWLRSNPSFDRVRVSHRRSNAPSRRANQQFGFAQTGIRETTWPDGTVEDMIVYEMPLERSAER